MASHASGAIGDRLRTPAAASERRAARTARSARRVADTLGALKGVFVKAGQFAALRYDVLPAAAQQIVAELQNDVPPISFEAIRAAVEKSLGCPLEHAFAAFDPAPIGAASVAQVHLAKLADGREVAVKVRYPWIADALPGDLRLARALLWVWDRASGRRSVDRDRVFDEFAAGLEDELDFEREARAAAEIAGNLASEPQIVVPAIVASHSTRDVLTMDYHPTLRLDRETLGGRGIAPREVLEILARAYARQVFGDGLFHADPHPGNLFVIDEPEAAQRPRVLFVDFGLCKRLDPALRNEMRHGIYALLQRDLDGFVERMDGMGMIAAGARAGVRESVGRMFDEIADRSEGRGALALGGAGVLSLKDQAKVLLQETPGIQLPNDLLLYAKTLSYLFALGAELDPEVDILRISTPYLLQFLAGRDATAAKPKSAPGSAPTSAPPDAAPAAG